MEIDGKFANYFMLVLLCNQNLFVDEQDFEYNINCEGAVVK